MLYPANIPALYTFHNESIWASVTAVSAFSSPPTVHLPPLHLKDTAWQNVVEKKSKFSTDFTAGFKILNKILLFFRKQAAALKSENESLYDLSPCSSSSTGFNPREPCPYSLFLYSLMPILSIPLKPLKPSLPSYSQASTRMYPDLSAVDPVDPLDF